MTKLSGPFCSAAGQGIGHARPAEPKPCPACASTYISALTRRTPDGWGIEWTSRLCGGCGLAGPQGKDYAEATRLWDEIERSADSDKD